MDVTERNMANLSPQASGQDKNHSIIPEYDFSYNGGVGGWEGGREMLACILPVALVILEQYSFILMKINTQANTTIYATFSPFQVHSSIIFSLSAADLSSKSLH